MAIIVNITLLIINNIIKYNYNYFKKDLIGHRSD